MGVVLIAILVLGLVSYGGYSVGFHRGVKSQESTIENLKKRYNKIRRDYMVATRQHS